MTEKQKTLVDFPCPYSIEDRYTMVCSGEFGVFEMYDNSGDVAGYRGYRKDHGTTGVYSTYKEALEAAFTEYGDARSIEKPTMRCVP